MSTNLNMNNKDVIIKNVHKIQHSKCINIDSMYINSTANTTNNFYKPTVSFANMTVL